MKEKQKVLVTGGAGYIGSHTVVELVAAGFEPVIIDDFRNSEERTIERIEAIVNKKIISYAVDMNEYDKIVAIGREHKVIGIIHFAAFKAVGESVALPLKYYSNNIQSMVNVLQLMLELKIKHFIFSSSCTVYGDPKDNFLVREDDDVTHAYSPYGFTKVIGERMLKDLSISNPELKILSLRYFNPIGAHPSAKLGELPIGSPNNLVPFITQTAIGKRPLLTVNGNDYPTKDGTCVRDYIHVVDLAKAHVSGLQHLLQKQTVVLDHLNIGTGKGTSILEMIRKFEAVTQQTLNYNVGPKRAGDVSEIYANTDKVKDVLDWEPQFSITDALLHAWNWEKSLKDEA